MKLARRLLILLVLVAAAGAYAFYGLFEVLPDQEAMILRLGQYHRTAGPGLQWHAWGLERLEIRPVTVTFREEFGYVTEDPGAEYAEDPEEERRMITGDTNLVNVQFVLQYKISNLRDYMLNVAAPEIVIRNTAEAAIRAVVGAQRIDDVLTLLKEQIARETAQKIQRILDEYQSGIQVLSVQLQDVQPPDPVKDAFAKVTSAEQDRESMVLEARGYADKVVPEARGEAKKVLNEAQGYKESRILRSQGEAERFESVLAEYKKAREVTRTRLYIETMEEVLPRMEKIILEDGSGAGVLPYLPLGRRGDPGR